MPTTRSQTRSMNRLEIPHSQPATVPAESPFAAIYSTVEINRFSSLFNDQASTVQTGIPRPETEPKPSDGQSGRASLFGDWKPSSENTRPLFAGNEDTPAPSTAKENTSPIFASNENPPSVNENTSLFAWCTRPRPQPPSLFGVKINYSSGPKPNSQAANQPQQPKEEDNSLSPDEYAMSLLERILKVDDILKNVNCLDDLTEDIVRALMATDYGLLTIMKFEVTLLEWADWSEPMKLKGLPVDLDNDGWNHVTIQCGRGITEGRDSSVPRGTFIGPGALLPAQKGLSSSSGWGPKPRDRNDSGRGFAFK